MSMPSHLIAPSLGSYSPAKSFANVVLPDPFSPISATTSPAPISSDTPDSAGRERFGYVKPTPSTASLENAGGAGRAPAPPAFSRLAVDGVGFTYPNRSRPALSGVSLEIGAGEVVALIGENGSGKTTLAKLLAGLYEPREGAIRWDGIDIASYEPAPMRASMAVVFQDFVRYHFSARENIALGRPERHDEVDAIEGAARAAGAHEFIVGLDDGYDTRLGP